MSDPVRILLADDHPLVRTGVRRILEAQPGLTVAGEVSTGDAALDFLRADPVDVLVLDLTMPGTGGDRVLAELRRIRPEVPVVMVSGYEEPALRDGLRPDAFVHKPFVLEELVEALRRVMPRG